MLLQNIIFSVPFKLNGFLSAVPGGIIFGDVKFEEGLVHYENNKVIEINYHKMEEFFELLKTLGKKHRLGDNCISYTRAVRKLWH